MEQTSTVIERPQAPPAAEPAQPDHGWPKEALVSEKEGYDHRDPAKKAEQTSIDAKKYLEASRREELAKQKAEREARLNPDLRIEQFQKQNEEALRQSVRSRPEVTEALSKAEDGETLWEAISEHPSLVKDFEDANAEQIEKLLQATREELQGTAKQAVEEKPAPEPANDYERILKTATEKGEEHFARVSETLDRFMNPESDRLAAVNVTMAAVLANEVAPELRAAVVHSLLSDPKSAMALENADSAEAIVKAVRAAAKAERLAQSKSFYSRFGMKQAAEVKEKPVTSAPPPPTEIGGKLQKAADPLDQALKDGDVQAYRRELNRQMAKSRRGY